APQASGEPLATVIEERARADETLREERASADEILRDERAKEAMAFARLLPLEREKTDLYLLTERARSDDALANRDDFLGMVSHDLRDLLQAIVMNAGFLSGQTTSDEKGKAALAATQRIQRSAGRMTRLIGDLVDI